MLNKKNNLFLVLLLIIVLLSGCKGDKFTKEYIIQRTVVQGEGQIEVNIKSSKEAEVKAVADKNWEFVRWKGSLTGSQNSRTIVLEEEVNLIAEFKYTGPDITGQGTEKSPFIIYTFAGLKKIGKEDYPLDAYYELGMDIDASQTQNKDYNNGQGWKPIGEVYDLNNENWDAFDGVFDGQGYKISNLYINTINNRPSGLFMVVEKGTIKNVNLVNINFMSSEVIGGLVGFSNGKIENCHVTGEIKATFRYIGGLIGINSGEIKNSSVNINIRSNSPNTTAIGGLVGFNHGLIKNSFALGEIEGSQVIGGLVGGNYEKGIIETSYATSNVMGNLAIGGLVGISAGVIRESYSSGNIIGKQGVGGLIAYSEGLIENSYTNSQVKGEKTVGGLIAVNEGEIKNSYWEAATSMSSSDGKARTTEEMKQRRTFKGWNFENVWMIDDGESYPYLMWQKNLLEDKLIKAVANNDIEEVRKLIEDGVNIDVRTDNGITPLMLATGFGYLEIVELLIDAGANVNINKYGETALMWAICAENLEIVKALVDAGANVNVNISIYVIDVIEAIEKGNKAYTNVSFDIVSSDNNKLTPLLLIAYKGKPKIAKVLIEAGADVNHTNNYDGTPLVCAAYSGNLKTVKVLINAGSNVNVTDNINTSTALMLAAEGGYLEIVKLLVEAGAETDIKDEDGEIALDLAVKKDQQEVIDYLLDINE